MALFGKKRKEAADDGVSLDNIDFECLYKSHMPPVTISENPEAVQICPTCENPMYPEVLARAILNGHYEARELNTTELANCVTILPFLFWAQHNVQNKPFVIAGMPTGEIVGSISIPTSRASQDDILKTLESLASFGSQEMGDAADLQTLLVLGRNFLQWTLSRQQPDGTQQVLIEPLPHFAVLNSKNLETLNKLVSQVSKQLGWATWERYIDFFAKPLTAQISGQGNRTVLEVSLDFQVSAKTQDPGLIANESVNPSMDLLSTNVLPIYKNDRLPTTLIGPVSLEVETQLDAYKTDDSYEDDEFEENFELEFKTSTKFLILSEKEIGETQSEMLSHLKENFSLAIYFETSSRNLSWSYLDDPSSPFIKSDLLDIQILNLGTAGINVKVTQLSAHEAAIRLEGTPWHM